MTHTVESSQQSAVGSERLAFSSRLEIHLDRQNIRKIGEALKRIDCPRVPEERLLQGILYAAITSEAILQHPDMLAYLKGYLMDLDGELREGK